MGRLSFVRNGGRTPERLAGNGLRTDLRIEKECHPMARLVGVMMMVVVVMMMAGSLRGHCHTGKDCKRNDGQ